MVPTTIEEEEPEHHQQYQDQKQQQQENLIARQREGGGGAEKARKFVKIDETQAKFVASGGVAAAAAASSSSSSSSSSSFNCSIRAFSVSEVNGKGSCNDNYTNTTTNNNNNKTNFNSSPLKKRAQKEITTNTSNTKQNSPNHLISSIVNKSNILLQNIKQQYSSYLIGNSNTTTTTNTTTDNIMTEQNIEQLNKSERNNVENRRQQQCEESQLIRMNKRDITERQLSDSSFFYSTATATTTTTKLSSNQLPINRDKNMLNNNTTKMDENSSTSSSITNINKQLLPSSPSRPPLPPPPPKEVLANVVNNQKKILLLTSSSANNNNNNNNNNQTILKPKTATNSPLTLTQSLDVCDSQKNSTILTGSTTSCANRRHAIQEQSLERDAALSFKLQQHKELKHKRTASIKSALKHAAHINPLGRHSSDIKHQQAKDQMNKSSDCGGGGGGSNRKNSNNNNNNNNSENLVKSMPYELFEPPVTQRTFQRSKRRDAMLSDPKRQLSADTIGLRQLTDEYLHNAGVKPISSSGKCSLVALTPPGATTGASTTSSMTTDSDNLTGIGSDRTIPAAAAGQQPANVIENQLYQVSKRMLPQHQHQQRHHHHHTGSVGKRTLLGDNNNNNNSNGSEDSLSFVTISPGNLPWQSDVSIQCELLQAPLQSMMNMVDNDNNLPYETTGDILSTIALPFRGSTMQLADLGGSGSLDGGGGGGGGSNQLAATFKRGLSAVINPQNHLSPAVAAVAATAATTSGPVAAALQVVGGNLKKSLSNTLDISLGGCVFSNNNVGNGSHHLQSQDSLPAYTTFHNEPDSVSIYGGVNSNTNNNNNNNFEDYNQQHYEGTVVNNSGSNSLIGQLASKLSRQSSKKFTVSKKGLQRALSFDCRGYKKLDGANEQSGISNNTNNNNNLPSSYNNNGKNNLLTTTTTTLVKSKSHNKSTLGLNSDQSPRPYLPQSASQVDFQIPLLPYHKMQEAIVSQRLLEPPKQQNDANNNGNLEQQQQQQQSVQIDNNNQKILVASGQQANFDADRLLCAQPSSDFTKPVEPQRDYYSVKNLEENNRSFVKESWRNVHSISNSDIRTPKIDNNDSSEARRSTAPRLVLDIPTISTQTSTTTTAAEAATKTNQSSLESINLQNRSKRRDKKRTTRVLQNRRNIILIKKNNKKEEEEEDCNYYNEDDNNDDQDYYDDDDDNYDSGEEVCANDNTNLDDNSLNINNNSLNINNKGVIVCLPSPNVSIDPTFNTLSSSPSFCLNTSNNNIIQDQHNHSNNNNNNNSNSTNQLLTANDVFSKSQSFIKRPSTMVTSDGMSQVAIALKSTGTTSSSSSNNQQQQQQQQQQNNNSIVLRNRRQAIVPPKLATDGNNSDNELQQQQVGQLVDVDDNNNDRQQQFDYDDDENMKAHRRKRSGGSCEKSTSNDYNENRINSKNSKNNNRPLSGSQSALPTFHIEQEQSDNNNNNFNRPDSVLVDENNNIRPDSQTTNIDSIVSSGSSGNLWLGNNNNGKRSGDFTVTSPGGLTVSFASSRGRRRSSIAVIPQMQICPGDLLVYSKQLIDRLNQNDNENENAPPQFLTIDDKKGKNNIWSSLKLFDNRTMKARNELLCSLEDVLASLQPSTFVDEQLSHYKGMLWNEFLYETESRRSASSEGLSVNNEQQQHEQNQNLSSYQDDLLTLAINDNDNKTSTIPNESKTTKENSCLNQESAPVGIMIDEQQQQKTSNNNNRSSIIHRESLKVSISTGPTGTTTISQVGNNNTTPQHHGSGIITTTATTTNQQQHKSRDQTVAGRSSLSSRFKEKPKLKRGQTVDSVFRIPLIPSSPLKHAQQHQQTPTAHLEEHNNILLTIEDDERSSINSRDSITASPNDNQQQQQHHRHSRSSSTRSRSGSNRHNSREKNYDLISSNNNKRDLINNNNNYEQDSSFETDDALDLIVGRNNNNNNNCNNKSNQHQIVRQSSLSTLSSTITRTEQKRQRALWDLFQSECTFFFDHLLTLKNVYMEPLKKIQVEGFAMFADPDVLFGNLDELCCGVYDFCKEFLYIIMRTLKTRPEELNATDVLIKLYKKNPKIDHLRGVYHRYTLNYINALTYLDSLRKQVEFVEFEKWSSRDVRCKKLQLTDLLVAPVQHIMRVPIILKDIESHTENLRDRYEIRAILAVEEASLRELDDKMRWLKNFERLLEIQKNINWPSVLELDPKLFVPEFLKEVLSKQPCERLIVSPRRQIVHEGTLSNFDSGKASDMHVILFDDMLLLTRRKKGLTKKASTVCKSNSGSSSTKDDGSFKYIVYKQPLSLDRFYVHDVQQVDAQAIGMKHLFLLIVMNRFQQISNVHSFLAPNDDVKQTWLFKIKKTAERWKSSNEQQQQQQQQTIQHQQKNQQQNQTDQIQHYQTHEQQPTLTRVINRNPEITNRLPSYSNNESIDDNKDRNLPAARIDKQYNQSQSSDRHQVNAKVDKDNYDSPNQDQSGGNRIELIVTSASGPSPDNSNYSNIATTASAH